MNMNMSKELKIVSITVPSALAAALVIFGGVTAGKTHSINPKNLAICSRFKHFSADMKTSNSEDFQDVKEFVDNKGKGTLVLLKDGHYTYVLGKNNIPKDQIVQKDWKAVSEYMKQFNDSRAYRKGVLKQFNVTEDEFDEILHLFWLAKEKYVDSDLYNFEKPFESFKPKKRFKKPIFLKAISEDQMKDLVYSYTQADWNAWKDSVSDTLDKDSPNNPVAACRNWVQISRQAADDLAASTGLTSQEVIKRLKTFKNIFYALTGIPVPSNHMYRDSLSLI